MQTQMDFHKEWEKAKKALTVFSQQALKVGKEWEKDVERFSKQSLLHIDQTAASLKKEHLFYLIGKEYIRTRNTSKGSAKLRGLLNEFKNLDKKQRLISRHLQDT